VLAPGGALEALQQAQEAGKIRFVGVSGHNRSTLVKTVQQAGEVIDVVQTLFNPLETDALDELIPLCANRRIGIVAMKAVGGGIFDCPAASMRWILSHPAISCTDPGMATLEEVEQNARVGTDDASLTQVDEREIESLRERLGRQYCRRCGACLPCPKGIDIITVLVGDSMILRMGRELYANRNFEAKIERVGDCHDCDECAGKCPAGLSIPELLPLQAERIRELVRAQ
jgi:predicted aldo/keto reductase-like oxidoreductase